MCELTNSLRNIYSVLISKKAIKLYKIFFKHLVSYGEESGNVDKRQQCRKVVVLTSDFLESTRTQRYEEEKTVHYHPREFSTNNEKHRTERRCEAVWRWTSSHQLTLRILLYKYSSPLYSDILSAYEMKTFLSDDGFCFCRDTFEILIRLISYFFDFR